MPQPDHLVHDKIVVVTRKTALEELIERHNSASQARFTIESRGGSFEEYEDAHQTYQRALVRLKSSLPKGARTQFIERGFLPTYTFGERDLIVTLGPDGLVVNAAKYLDAQPLLAFNPDRARVDGVLVPFPIEAATHVLQRGVRGQFSSQKITMAQAVLDDGQTLLAVNDFFVGRSTHVSARYGVRYKKQQEDQSSSGIIVSTGAGSTGWHRSVLTGAAEVMEACAAASQTDSSQADSSQADPQLEAAKANYRFDAQAEYLRFCVREPFISKTSSAQIVFGQIEAHEPLEIVSQMPQNGVIFSDGIESDFLEFNSGATARISVAQRKLHLVRAV